MKKLETKILGKNGIQRTISVWVEDATAKILEKQDKDFIHDYIVDEYKASLSERRETRRHQSLNKSMDNGFDVADDRVDIETELIENEEKAMLHKAISKLEPQQQWLIVEIFYKGRKQVDIARELGVGESAIRSRLSKIFAQIKKLLN